jgi:hypothetical protein
MMTDLGRDGLSPVAARSRSRLGQDSPATPSDPACKNARRSRPSQNRPVFVPPNGQHGKGPPTRVKPCQRNKRWAANRGVVGSALNIGKGKRWARGVQVFLGRAKQWCRRAD